MNFNPNQMSHERRLFLTIALCMMVFGLWQIAFPPPEPVAPPATTNGDAAATPTTFVVANPNAGATATAQALGTDPAATGTALTEGAATQTPIATEAPIETRFVNGDVFIAKITNVGGGLVSFGATRYKKPKKPAEPVEVVTTPDTAQFPATLDVSLGTALPRGARYAYGETVDPHAVVLTRESKALSVTKTLRFQPAGYHADMQIELTAREAVEGDLAVHVTRVTPTDEQTKPGMFTPPVGLVNGACVAAGKLTEEAAADLADEKLVVAGEAGEANIAWAGVNEQYFVGAVLPNASLAATPLRCEADGTEDGAVTARLIIPGVKLKAGETRSFSFTGYMGPKQLEVLEAVHPSLEQSVNFWVLGFISRPMLSLMKWFNTFTHNWGLAIILLTIVVNLVIYPIKQKAFQNMSAMQALKPEMDKLKEKHGADRERFNTELMQLYKKHGVNPLGGCLPMFLQMPIWFALYRTISAAVDLYQQPFIPGWLNDLTAPDPFYVLPVALMGLTFLQQRMTPAQGMDPQQQKIMQYMMPLMFGAFMFALPSGLNLYVTVNSTISFVQQYLTNRKKLAAAAGSKESAK